MSSPRSSLLQRSSFLARLVAALLVLPSHSCSLLEPAYRVAVPLLTMHQWAGGSHNSASAVWRAAVGIRGLVDAANDGALIEQQFKARPATPPQ